MPFPISAPPASRRLAALLLAALIVPACSDGTGTTVKPGTPGIALLTQLPAADSIGAALPALEIEVRDPKGRPAAGATVQLEGSRRAPPVCGVPCVDQPTVLFSVDGTTPGAASVTLTTDAAGIARTRASVGGVPGEAGFTVLAPAFGYTAAFRLEARAGAATRIDLSPADSAVQFGNGYQLRVKVTDRLGNPPTDAVSLTTPGTALALNGGMVFGRVFGQALGRGEIVATAGAVTARAFVSVVPSAMIASTRDIAGATTIVLMQIAGGQRRTFAVPSHTTARGWDTYSTALVLLYDEPGLPERISTMDVSTGAIRLVLDAGAQGVVQSLDHPRFSADGQWIYFSGRTSPTSNPTLWRIRRNGTGLAQMVAQTAPYVSANAPDPSPDGKRLAYSGRHEEADGPNDLYLLDLATGTHTRILHEPAFSPRWSTDGRVIAFIAADGRPCMVQPDGNGRQVLLDAPVRSLAGWSQYAQWLMVHGEAGWIVIEPRTGTVVPLPAALTGQLFLPAWMPFDGLEGVRARPAR
jgi:hypothetical protein